MEPQDLGRFDSKEEKKDVLLEEIEGLSTDIRKGTYEIERQSLTGLSQEYTEIINDGVYMEKDLPFMVLLEGTNRQRPHSVQPKSLHRLFLSPVGQFKLKSLCCCFVKIIFN